MYNERRLKMSEGYKTDFIDDDKIIPLPTFSPDIEADILRGDKLKDGYIRDYLHYSVVMSKSKRQAIYSIANLDQGKFKQVKGRNWFVDPVIGSKNQLDNRYYYKNPWDRGHITRRTAVTWGDSSYTARKASNESCSFANATLQHENFNQDEWRVPELYIQSFDRARNGKISIITGSIFTENDRFYVPRNARVEPARVPSGFWKIIYYIDKKKSAAAGEAIIGCEAFIVYQDDISLRDKSAQKHVDIKTYQVTTSEIEDLTGLYFGEDLYNSNPLWYNVTDGRNILEPEMYEIKTAKLSTVKKDWPGHIIHERDDIDKHGFIRVSK